MRLHVKGYEIFGSTIYDIDALMIGWCTVTSRYDFLFFGFNCLVIPRYGRPLPFILVHAS